MRSRSELTGAPRRDPEVLRAIGRCFKGRLALNAEVVRPGTIGVGDRVTLVVGASHFVADRA